MCKSWVSVKGQLCTITWLKMQILTAHVWRGKVDLNKNGATVKPSSATIAIWLIWRLDCISKRRKQCVLIFCKCEMYSFAKVQFWDLKYLEKKLYTSISTVCNLNIYICGKKVKTFCCSRNSISGRLWEMLLKQHVTYTKFNMFDEYWWTLIS